ncbi:hypothetical protein CB1_000259019 [Camelus ferus]|nr:hypothetical protein CB1_000259019 [Camelus ferus]
MLCLCLNPGICGVWVWSSWKRCPAQSGHSGNNLLSRLHSDMKSERRAPSPDVIVLSDNEQPASPRVNGLSKETLKETSTEALMKSSPEERERMIKQLKEELRLEEAKLVLLKKLRQSQIQKETTTQKPTGSTGSSVTTPPPLVRGTQNIPSGKPSLQGEVQSSCSRP